MKFKISLVLNDLKQIKFTFIAIEEIIPLYKPRNLYDAAFLEDMEALGKRFYSFTLPKKKKEITLSAREVFTIMEFSNHEIFSAIDNSLKFPMARISQNLLQQWESIKAVHNIQQNQIYNGNYPN